MISIFVSSTFRDMHHERDLLQTRVIPAIDALARERGETVSFCDLRWGVNTADLDGNEGSRKILSICMDEIDYCRPYLLAFLGERYGTVMDEDAIRAAAQGKGFTPDDGDFHKSVTALEIEYGAKADLSRTLFYLRGPMPSEAGGDYSPEGDVESAKLKQLKDKIKKLPGAQVAKYALGWDAEKDEPTGLDELADRVVADLTALLQPRWAETENLSEYEREERRHWAFAEEKAAQFAAREALVERWLSEDVEAPKLIAIRGETGTGKSTLACKLATEARAQGWEAYPFICGNTPMSATGMDVIRQLTHKLERLTGSTHFEEMAAEREKGPDGKKVAPAEWREGLTKICELYGKTRGKRLLIVIDGLDQLAGEETATSLRFLPYSLPDNVRVVLTCLDSFPLPEALPLGGAKETLGSLDEAEKRAVAEGILAWHSKALDEEVMGEILRKTEANNPLYLSMLLQRLTMLDREDFMVIGERATELGPMGAISGYLAAVVRDAPPNLDGLSTAIVDEVGERVGEELTRCATECLAVSRHGLRRSDLEALFQADGMPWSALDFARLTNYLRGFFLEREDGRVDFTHRVIREGLLSRLGKDREGQWNRSVLEHLLWLDKDDTVRVNEIVYHMFHADDKEDFVHHIESYEDDDNKAIARKAAEEIYTLCLDDSGTWLLTILDGETPEAGSGLVSFVDFELTKAFGRSKRDMELLLPILESNKRRAQKLDAETPSSKSQFALALSYDNIGDVHRILGEFARARKVYEKGLVIRERLAREHWAPEHKHNLSVSYEKIGDVNSTLGEHVLALEAYEKSLEIAERLGRELGTQESQRDLLLNYSKMGDVHSTLGEYVRAREEYEKGLEISERLAQELGTPESQRDLSLCYDGMGDVHSALGEHVRAREAYEKGLAIRERLAQELGTPESQQDLMASYSRMGNVHSNLGEHVRAREAYENGLVISERLAQDLGTPESIYDHCLFLIKTAQLPDTSKEDRERMLSRVVDIAKRLLDQTELPRYKKMLHFLEEYFGR